jgi:hypothetical protein
LEAAVHKATASLRCTNKAEEVLAAYDKKTEKTREQIAGSRFVEKVAIAHGTYYC